MGKTNRDKNKFVIPTTLNPQAHIKASEDAKPKKKVQTKRPVPKVKRNDW